jgi:hypothetical protein
MSHEHYLVIPSDSFVVEGTYSDPSSPTSPTYPLDPTKRLVPIDPADLGSKLPVELLETHDPQISGDPPGITSWQPKAPPNPVTATPDGSAKDDLSNTVTVAISGGPVDGEFDVVYTRTVSCNLPGCHGTLDGNGDGEFKVKVYGPGDVGFTVITDDPTYSQATGTITVVPGDFI